MRKMEVKDEGSECILPLQDFFFLNVFFRYKIKFWFVIPPSLVDWFPPLCPPGREARGWGCRIIDCIEIRPQYLGTPSDWFRLCSQVKTWERSQLCSSEPPIILCSQELRSERSQVWSWEHSELKTWKHWGFSAPGRILLARKKKWRIFFFKLEKVVKNKFAYFYTP